MKRLHVHLKVGDLDRSIDFYSALFGRGPDKREADYAKWLLEDPAANVSISNRAGEQGVDHVGVQVEDAAALDAFAGRLRAAGEPVMQEEDATCCYARSHKYWTRSPEGAVWELFHTFGDSQIYGASPALQPAEAGRAACCPPAA